MTAVIALAWPLVALVFGGLVVWRVDQWVRARWSGDATQLALANLAMSRQHDSNLLDEHAGRLDKLEAALRVTPPPVDKHPPELLKRFR